MAMGEAFFRWNNQGAARSGFHEMWFRTVDGWFYTSTETTTGEWTTPWLEVPNGYEEQLPDFSNSDWIRIG